MSIKIGLFGGAFKPLTKGHYSVIEKASNENDKVYLFVSTKNRKRKKQLPVYWEDMENIWKNVYEKYIPNNVHIGYVAEPVGSIIDILYNASEHQYTHCQYCVYSTHADIINYKSPTKLKKLNFLTENNHLKFIPVDRFFNASGTLMRYHILYNNFDSFKNDLPKQFINHAKYIYEILRQRVCETEVP